MQPPLWCMTLLLHESTGRYGISSSIQDSYELHNDAAFNLFLSALAKRKHLNDGNISGQPLVMNS